MRRAALGSLLAIAMLAACLPAAAAASPPVTVFPIAGSRMATERTQIVFRGLPVTRFGTITVRGSRSGVHPGRIRADSDGLGGSFFPKKRFRPGETVTVTTSLDILGGSHGKFHFTVAEPAGAIGYARRPAAHRVDGDVDRFHSTDLTPAAVKILRQSGRTAAGDIFLAPQEGPVQWGPELLNPEGGLVWFDPLPDNETASDFRAQTYMGQPVLTWWQGQVGAGIGAGQDVVYDSSYQRIATVRAANGLRADLHEFTITPNGDALITACHFVIYDATAVHGAKRQDVCDAVVQEIDIKTGLVLYQWDSLDHVPLTYSYALPPGRAPYDYFHLNSVQLDPDGNLIISSRNTSAAYKVSQSDGAIMWTLGGRHSSFRFGPGASFSFQHDVEVRASGDRFVTIFNDAGGPPRSAADSSGLKLKLNLKHRTATVYTVYRHSPGLVSDHEGNVQQLGNDDAFIGWGQANYFSEFSPTGKLLYDGKFVGANESYRAYRYRWTGTPATPPAVALGRGSHGTTSVYVSWNGATTVQSWAVEAGSSNTTLKRIARVPRSGFETRIDVRPNAPYLAVQALSASGAVIGTSPTRRS